MRCIQYILYLHSVHDEFANLPASRPQDFLHRFQEHTDGDASNILSMWADSMRALVNRPKSSAGLATQAERKFLQNSSDSR